MPRVVVLGCGTGIGKTRVSVALLRALATRNTATIGLKPIESGIVPGSNRPPGSDADALSRAGTLRPSARSPLYAFKDPLSPHLAARAAGLEIDERAVAAWVTAAEAEVALCISPGMVLWSVIETAGGAFSPVSDMATNIELALALEPALWVLVASDSLGVLHDVSATLQAMRARQRAPDHVVLSGAREPDASTGSNARELEALGIVTPSAVLERNDDRGIELLVSRLLARRGAS